jgi:Flp pilus assembly pilin Flp
VRAGQAEKPEKRRQSHKFVDRNSKNRPKQTVTTQIDGFFSVLLEHLVRDDSGGEVLEYAIVSGLIVMAAIAIVGKVGSKVLARWNSLNSSM